MPNNKFPIINPFIHSSMIECGVCMGLFIDMIPWGLNLHVLVTFIDAFLCDQPLLKYRND